MTMAEGKTVYFVAKVMDIGSLRKCLNTSQWACRDRENPPNPRTILLEALHNGKVILLYSVNNCHGWHGYAEMIGMPGSVQPIREEVSQKSANDMTDAVAMGDIGMVDVDGWFYFPVEWKCAFLKDFGEQCLSFKTTETLVLLDNTPVNKSRNWQEVPQQVGEKMCHLLDDAYQNLCLAREEKIRRVQEKQLPAFFSSVDDKACEQNWRRIVEKVESTLGTVLLACPFGSQRYNLSIPESDTDMFIVYQAPTKDVLGFKPPKKTIKSGDTEMCDYTIHEVYRYCELLMSGDARCVETLFLDPSTVIQSSQALEALTSGSKLFLNRECLMKYMRDAQGTRGTKLLQKWCAENQNVTELPKKMRKLVYVVVRLLQNALNIVKGEDLVVYRADDSEEKEILMRIRNGPLSVQKAWDVIHSHENALENGKEKVPEKNEDLEKFVESWLLDLRYSDMIQQECERI